VKSGGEGSGAIILAGMLPSVAFADFGLLIFEPKKQEKRKRPEKPNY